MFRLLHILLLSLVFLGAPCCAITIKTNDIHTIESQVTQANPETLVIFDVDDVLMTRFLQQKTNLILQKLKKN